MKTCNKCGEEKPFTDFSKRKDTRDGLNYKCKACDSAYQAQRYLQNPDAIKANAKKWADANPERKRGNHAKWRDENRQVLLEKMRRWWRDNLEVQRRRQAEWRAANKEHIAIKNRQWREANPGKDLALSRKKKAAKIQRTPQWADNAKITAIYEEAAARRLAGEDVHVDHEVPLQGALVSGLHVHNNLRIIPATENLKKRNKFSVSVNGAMV
jgi:hypothetical protein